MIRPWFISSVSLVYPQFVFRICFVNLLFVLGSRLVYSCCLMRIPDLSLVCVWSLSTLFYSWKPSDGNKTMKFEIVINFTAFSFSL